MDYDIYKAPQGYVYEKDGEHSLTIIVPKGSNVIEKYNLVDIEDIEQKENK